MSAQSRVDHMSPMQLEMLHRGDGGVSHKFRRWLA
jgi:hypothetical protein